MLVDLHIHTCYSDGTMTPEEVVIKAKERGVKIVAITDHNRIDSWEEFSDIAIRENIIPIKGVEINVKYKNKVLHLLAYNFNNTPELLKLIRKADFEMQKMSYDLIVNLSKVCDKVSVKDFETYHYNPKNGGWKGLHYLLDRGVTNKLFDGFYYYNKYGCGYELYDFPSLKEACDVIAKSKGYSVLAHPGEYYKLLSKDQLLNELDDLIVEGIQGIECYYPTHDKLITDICVELSNRHNLLVTSGSDDHGEFGKEAKAIDQSIGCIKKNISDLNISDLIKTL